MEELLEGFTTEIGITADQFMQSCTQLMGSQAGQDNEVIAVMTIIYKLIAAAINYS